MIINYRDRHGRRVNTLEEALRSHVDGMLSDKMKSVRCPVHGATMGPVTITHRGDQAEYVGPVCCDRLREAINEAFGAR